MCTLCVYLYCTLGTHHHASVISPPSPQMAVVLVSRKVNFFHDDGPKGRLLNIRSSLVGTLKHPVVQDSVRHYTFRPTWGPTSSTLLLLQLLLRYILQTWIAINWWSNTVLSHEYFLCLLYERRVMSTNTDKKLISKQLKFWLNFLSV